MIKTIATLSAAAAFAVLSFATAQAAKNNPKFQAELMEVARGDKPPAKANPSAPDATGSASRKVN